MSGFVGTGHLHARLQEATTAAMQVAGVWLAEAMRQLVSVQCNYKDHAAEGEPPKMESGRG